MLPDYELPANEDFSQTSSNPQHAATELNRQATLDNIKWLHYFMKPRLAEYATLNATSDDLLNQMKSKLQTWLADFDSSLAAFEQQLSEDKIKAEQPARGLESKLMAVAEADTDEATFEQIFSGETSKQADKLYAFLADTKKASEDTAITHLKSMSTEVAGAIEYVLQNNGLLCSASEFLKKLKLLDQAARAEYGKQDASILEHIMIQTSRPKVKDPWKAVADVISSNSELKGVLDKCLKQQGLEVSKFLNQTTCCAAYLFKPEKTTSKESRLFGLLVNSAANLINSAINNLDKHWSLSPKPARKTIKLEDLKPEDDLWTAVDAKDLRKTIVANCTMLEEGRLRLDVMTILDYIQLRLLGNLSLVSLLKDSSESLVSRVEDDAGKLKANKLDEDISKLASKYGKPQAGGHKNGSNMQRLAKLYDMVVKAKSNEKSSLSQLGDAQPVSADDRKLPPSKRRESFRSILRGLRHVPVRRQQHRRRLHCTGVGRR